MPLRERKQQFVRDAIWDAAIDLFSTKGFDETTVDEIAQAAGTSRRSFFRYFKSKSDLLGQPVVSFRKSLIAAIEGCSSSTALADVLREVVVGVARNSASDPRTRKLMAIAAEYPAAREAQLASAAGLQDDVSVAFAQWCHRNGRTELDAHILAALALPLLNVIYTLWFDHGDQDVSDTATRVFEALNTVAGAELAVPQKTPANRSDKRLKVQNPPRERPSLPRR